jgi:hypothetical protein
MKAYLVANPRAAEKLIYDYAKSRVVGGKFREPKIRTFQTRGGKRIPVDISTPEGSMRARQLAASGAVLVAVKAEQSLPLPEQVARNAYVKSAESLAKERDTLLSLRNQAVLLAASDGYMGTGGEGVHKLMKALQTQFGFFKGMDLTSPEVFMAQNKNIALKMLGGSLGKAISDSDRKFIMSTVMGLGNTRKDFIRYLALRQLMFKRANARKQFLDAKMSEGVPLNAAMRMWDENVNKHPRPLSEEDLKREEEALDKEAKIRSKDKTLISMLSKLKPELLGGKSGKKGKATIKKGQVLTGSKEEIMKRLGLSDEEFNRKFSKAK